MELKFCGHCGYESDNSLLCLACRTFELKHKRVRRLNPDHEIEKLATLDPQTMKELKSANS